MLWAACAVKTGVRGELPLPAFNLTGRFEALGRARRIRHARLWGVCRFNIFNRARKLLDQMLPVGGRNKFAQRLLAGVPLLRERHVCKRRILVRFAGQIAVHHKEEPLPQAPLRSKGAPNERRPKAWAAAWPARSEAAKLARTRRERIPPANPHALRHPRLARKPRAHASCAAPEGLSGKIGCLRARGVLRWRGRGSAHPHTQGRRPRADRSLDASP